MMTWIKRLVAVAIIIGAILLFLDSKDRGSRPAPPTPPPTATATPQPVAPPVQVRTQAPPAAPQAPTAALQQAAQSVGLRLVGVQPDRGYWLVTVTASNRNALGDFLDAAIRNGMKDVDLNYPNNYSQNMQNGRPVFSQTFRVRF